jgi:hypothetical protein
VADLDDPTPGNGVDQFGLLLGNGRSLPSTPVTGKVTVKP